MSTIRWLDAGTLPAQPGVYRVRIPNLDRQTWARWTGIHWCNWAVSPEQAARCEWAGIRTGYDWQP